MCFLARFSSPPMFPGIGGRGVSERAGASNLRAPRRPCSGRDSENGQALQQVRIEGGRGTETSRDFHGSDLFSQVGNFQEFFT